MADQSATVAETRPFAAFEWMLAGRYLRARRREGFISVIAGFSFLGIMLSVATLIIVMSIMNGFRAELFDRILGLNGHMLVRPMGRAFTDYEDVAGRLRTLSQVKAVLPVIEGHVLVTTPSASGGIYLRGIREADIPALKGVASNVVSGGFQGFDTAGGIAIGTRLAETLKVKVGDKVSVMSRDDRAPNPNTASPRVKRYTIRAIFEIGMSEYDMTVGFLPLEEAQNYFARAGTADVLEVLVDDPENSREMRPTLLDAVGPDMMLTDWRDRSGFFQETLRLQRAVLFLILALILLVAALNIISGLIMLVKDKGRDIGILRTMGLSRGAVMRVFFITGTSIGVAGTLAGIILGIVVSFNIESVRQFLSWATNTDLFPKAIYFLSHLPASVAVSDVLVIAVLAIGLSMLATLYPSWRATRFDPVEALRYE